MAMEDKIGAPVRFSEIQAMRDCMATCELTEVNTVVRLLTWNNKLDGVDRVFTRIDRVLANSLWEDQFMIISL